MHKGYVLITGASSKIDKKLAKLFAKKERNLVIRRRLNISSTGSYLLDL